MRAGNLPATVDPIKLAESGTRLTGELPVKAMGRLCALCLDESGTVSIRLSFERSGDRGLGRMQGTIAANLQVVCQRCLEKMTLVLRAEPSVILIRAQDREDLIARDTDSFVVDGPILLSNIVEDELLLAMPMVPMHDIDECLAGKYRHRQEKPNPFSVLGELKHKD
jgi:uncharacterized protein